MLVVYFWIVLYYKVQCEILVPTQTSENDSLIKCIIGILETYYANEKQLTFVNINSNDDALLKAINSMTIFSIILREPAYKLPVLHEGYLISAKDTIAFNRHFMFLTRERSWDPSARFLIIVDSLQTEDLHKIFTVLLKLHVFNVLLINGTEDANLYTYNPFNNYACGRYFDQVISYGKCLNNTQDLFPYKFVTGLNNCTFTATVPHWPPYTINPSISKNRPKVGAEQAMWQLIGEIEGFNVVFHYDSDGDDFSTVNTDTMVAVGSLSKLQNNKSDAIIGAMMLIPSRAGAFSYIFNHLTYVDEIRFMVKQAKLVAPWKNFYLEFETRVWVLLIVALLLFWLLIIVLLHSKDKTYLMLKLLDTLCLHGFDVRCRLAIKCVLILWVWFAYLVNTYYQSSLVSITTNPIQEYQISTEDDIAKYNLRPCLSDAIRKYIEVSSIDVSHDVTEGCHSILGSLKTVTNGINLYTIVLRSLYNYDRQDYYDEYGASLAYSLKKPYGKVIYAIYLYNGFPMKSKLDLDALRIRENGLADKILSNMYFMRRIQHHYHAEHFHAQFAVPWYAYMVACIISTFAFVIEIFSKQKL